MEVANTRFRPGTDRDRESMLALQRDIADAARFENDAAVLDRLASRTPADAGPVRPGDGPLPGPELTASPTDCWAGEPPLVAGVDQAFVDDRVLSAVVCVRGDAVVARSHAVVETPYPYVPGLLAFREAGAMVDALAALDATPDCLLVDGSGRIHYREAGLATHVGLIFDVPAVGVAKSLLCGDLPADPDGGFPTGTRVQITADDEFETAAAGTPVGLALQSRQYDGSDRHVNPLYVSPGHRVGVQAAGDLVAAACDGYKLPEPIRLADARASELTAELAGAK